MRTLLVALALVSVVLAGCATDSDASDAPAKIVINEDLTPSVAGFAGLPLNMTPVFSAPLLVDDVRAGGEPVIAVLPSGTIMVSAHPGWTHYHPSEDPTHVGTEILTPANVQSYLWRSTDGGETWSHVNLAGLPVDNLPRSTAIGVSDPEWTVMEDGTICGTDLIALASSSTSCSHDDGVTWYTNGNPTASKGVNDRQWLASWQNEFYFTANYFVDHHIQASTDYGITWETRGNVPCSQDLVTNPHNGNLIVACGAGIAISEDQGWNWERRAIPNPDPDTISWGGQRIMAEPAIDAGGNTWVTWTTGERQLWMGGSPDEGLTWPWIIDLTPHFNLYSQNTDLDASAFGGPTTYDLGTNGSYIWPWISAGSDGRVAVSWIGGFSETHSSTYADPWFFFTAYVFNANTAEPSVFVKELSPNPIHFGPICQSGTTCQVASMGGDDSGDRRLGDFFETTIDAEGYLHASVSDTWTKRDDVISHALYVRQIDGLRLLTDEDVGVFMPTQG